MRGRFPLAGLAIATIASMGMAASPPVRIEEDYPLPVSGGGAFGAGVGKRFNLHRDSAGRPRRPTSKYDPRTEDRKHGFVPRRSRGGQS